MNSLQMSLLHEAPIDSTESDGFDGIQLKSVTSLSGGKTSGYMAIHYPTDVYLFSVVLTNDQNCIIQDKGLRRYCQEKIQWFDWDKGGSRELDLTLANLQKLEQELGTEITWVSAPFTFDELIAGKIDKTIGFAFDRSVTKPMLPNARTRFCTQSLKIYPMAWWMYLNGNGLPWIMNIGFRADEPQRVLNWKCDRTDMTLHCDIEGSQKWKHRHQMLDYRMVRFPLYEDRIDALTVGMYWHKKGWQFPTESNCDFCFNKRPGEMRSQFSKNPDRAQWWIDAEERVGATFGDRPLKEIISTDIDYDSLPVFCLCND